MNNLTPEEYFLREISVSSEEIISSSKCVPREDTHARLRALNTESEREIKCFDDQRWPQDSGMQDKTKEHTWVLKVCKDFLQHILI